MPFQLSPGVNVTEIDLTTVIPAVATTDAAIGGVFRWGPLEKTTLVVSEDELVSRYGKPTNFNPETFFTAASYLAYSNRLHVSRAGQVTGNTWNASLTLESGNTTVEVPDTVTDRNNWVVGDAVFGEGIAEGTIITNIDTDPDSNTTTTEYHITLSEAPTASVTSDVQVFDSGYTFNAIANTNSANLANSIVKNEDHYAGKGDALLESDPVNFAIDDDVQFVAKYPGALGNSLKISVCDSATAFNSTINLATYDAANTTDESITFTVGSNSAVISVSNTATGDSTSSEAVVNAALADLSVGDKIKVGNSSIGVEYLTITSIGSAVIVDDGLNPTGEVTATITFDDRYSLSTATAPSSFQRYWDHWGLVEAAPGQSTYQLQNGNTSAQDELHIVVSDEDGKITGVPGTVLEVFGGLSRATDAKSEDGASIYFKEVINQSSRYVWFANDMSGAGSAEADLLSSSTNDAPYTKSFIGGRDGDDEASVSIGTVIKAYDYFKSAEDIDISLVLTGKARGGVHGEQLANYLVDNIAEKRKDCVVFLSPDKNDVVNNIFGDEEDDVVQFRNACRSTSYGVLDSGYKYMYDKYNDVYRWVPMNGDTAGLCAYTDDERDPWWSPAGFNRGQIKNVVKLSWNPRKAERDILYKNGVNPIVNFPGQGIIMFGDKTLLAKPSAFDRINVRRLFIVLEKAIATASKFTLFEFNDEFTRSSFVNLVTPYLRDVQGRRGIYDFTVVCDETNNTGEVIDRNEFIGDIYIKPARSINFIQLNFVAVRTGVEFSEVIGNF